MKSQMSRQSFEDEVRKALLQINNFIILGEIRAPVTGKLYRWNKESKSTVAASANLGQIIPQNSKIIAKINVLSKDLPKIEKGQVMAYKLEAFPYEKFGTGDGVVLDVKNIKNEQNAFEVQASLRAPANVEESQIPIGSGFTVNITTRETKFDIVFAEQSV